MQPGAIFFLATVPCAPVAPAQIAGRDQRRTNALPSPYQGRFILGFQPKIRTNSGDGLRLVRRWLGDSVGIGGEGTAGAGGGIFVLRRWNATRRATSRLKESHRAFNGDDGRPFEDGRKHACGGIGRGNLRVAKTPPLQSAFAGIPLRRMPPTTICDHMGINGNGEWEGNDAAL